MVQRPERLPVASELTTGVTEVALLREDLSKIHRNSQRQHTLLVQSLLIVHATKIQFEVCRQFRDQSKGNHHLAERKWKQVCIQSIFNCRPDYVHIGDA